MAENCMQAIPFWYATPFMRFLYTLILMVAITVLCLCETKSRFPLPSGSRRRRCFLMNSMSPICTSSRNGPRIWRLPVQRQAG